MAAQELAQFKVNDKYRLEKYFDSLGRLTNTNLPRINSVGEQFEKKLFLKGIIENLECLGGTFSACRLIDTQWLNSNINSCLFEDCVFLNSTLESHSLRNTLFQRCTFDRSPINFLREVTAEDNVQFIDCVFLDSPLRSTEPLGTRQLTLNDCLQIQAPRIPEEKTTKTEKSEAPKAKSSKKENSPTPPNSTTLADRFGNLEM